MTDLYFLLAFVEYHAYVKFYSFHIFRYACYDDKTCMHTHIRCRNINFIRTVNATVNATHAVCVCLCVYLTCLKVILKILQFR